MSDDNLERRAAYLREWEVGVVPCEERGGEMDKAAVDYSLLGIKSAYVLNAGALVALPAIIPLLQLGPNEDRSFLIVAAGFYVCGILCAILFNTFSYFAVCYFGLSWFQAREHKAYTLAKNFYPAQFPPKTIDPKLVEFDTGRVTANKKGKLFRVLAMVAGGLSGLCFLAGATLIFRDGWS